MFQNWPKPQVNDPKRLLERAKAEVPNPYKRLGFNAIRGEDASIKFVWERESGVPVPKPYLNPGGSTRFGYVCERTQMP